MFSVILSSCSVKEDRTVCPCVLILDLEGIDRQMVSDAYLFAASADRLEFSDRLVLEDIGDEYVTSVPRGKLHLSVWSSCSHELTFGGIDIPLGKDCPRVYMHDSDLELIDEEVRETIHMHKNHCVMTISTEAGRMSFSGARIIGNVSGYTSEGLPAIGKFEYVLDDSNDDNECEVVLPRQTDASLALLVDDGYGDVKSFSIGQYIVSSGYDWTAPDLEDITVLLDYALTQIIIKIEGWESVFTYKVEM